MPTTTASARAAAPSQNRYSGTLPSSTPIWPAPRRELGHDRSNEARTALAATTWRQLHC